MQRGAALYSGQPSEGYLVMAEATPRIGAQWLASQGSFACGEAQDDMSSIGETLSGRNHGEGKVGGEASNMAPGAST